MRMLAIVVALVLAGVTAVPGSQPPQTFTVTARPTELHQLLKFVSPPPDLEALIVLQPGVGYEAWLRSTLGSWSLGQVVARPGIYAAAVAKPWPGASYEELYTFYVTATGVEVCPNGNESPSLGCTMTVPIPGTGGFAPGQLLSAAASAAPNLGNSPTVADLAAIVGVDRFAVGQDDGGLPILVYDVVQVSGEELHSLAVGELNGGGRQDIALLNRTTGNVIVMLNATPILGGGTFNRGATISFGGGGGTVRGLTIMDADGDADDDVLAADGPGGLIKVSRSLGGGAFDLASTLYSLPGATIEDIGAADLDGDLDPDIAFTATLGGDAWLGFLENQGAGVFVLTDFVFDTRGAASGQMVLSAQSNICGGSHPNNNSVTAWSLSGSQPTGAKNLLGGPGHGVSNPPTCQVATSGGALAFSAQIYGATGYGLNVGAGDIDGVSRLNGSEEALFGPGPGPIYGPQVRGYARAGAQLQSIAKVNFYGYGTLRFGVNVCSADVDGDSISEILTGPGPGAVFGPHIRAWNFDGVAVTSISKINFFAFGTTKYGANVGGGDVDGDGFGEVLVGPGPGSVFTAQVRGFNYDNTSVGAMGKINFVALPSSYGAKVSVGDVDTDGFEEMAIVGGEHASVTARFVGFGFDALSIAPLAGFDVTPWPSRWGGSVGLGDVRGSLADTRADLIAGAGPDGASAAEVRVYLYDGTGLTEDLRVVVFPSLSFGTNVVSADLGF